MAKVDILKSQRVISLENDEIYSENNNIPNNNDTSNQSSSDVSSSVSDTSQSNNQNHSHKK